MAPSSIRMEETARLDGQSMKLKNLLFNNFRSFSEFNIRDMGRITLLVGTNNSGKTTVLEAISLLLSVGDPSSIWSILSRRGEDLWGERDPNASLPTSRQVDIRRLFRGHEIEVGRSFSLQADTDANPIRMSARIEEPRQVQPTFFDIDAPPPESAEDFLPPLIFTAIWTPGRGFTLPISRRGGISIDSIRRSARSGTFDGFQVRYVNASSLNAEFVTMLFEDIALTPAEELVTQAMRLIEPDIERIASSGGERIRTSSRSVGRGGIIVKLKSIKDRVPIGSLGDGIWRLLGLALSVVQSPGDSSSSMRSTPVCITP